MKRTKEFFDRLHMAWRVLTRAHCFAVFYDSDVAPGDMARSTSVYAAGAFLGTKAKDGGFGGAENASARLHVVIHALTMQDDLLLYWRDHADGQCYAAWACESDGRLQELLSLTVDTETGHNAP